jgi:UDP-glucose 4-epimerase
MSSGRSRKRGGEPIAIAGISGNLGRLLTRTLHGEHPIIGIDQRPFEEKPKDVTHYQVDARRSRAEDIFRRRDIRALVHLGLVHRPTPGRPNNREWNVLGAVKLLEYCQRYSVPKVVLLSTAYMYGPGPTNSNFLSEDTPLLGAENYPEMRALIEWDMFAQSFFWKYPAIETVILRPVHVVGPNVRNAPCNYLRMRKPPMLLGFDPMLQLVHENDLIQAILLSLEPGMRGVFNIVGPGEIPLSILLKEHHLDGITTGDYHWLGRQNASAFRRVMTLLVAALLFASAAPVRVAVLPLDREKSAARLAADLDGILREVAAQMPGVENIEKKTLDRALSGKVGVILRRCGKQKDCRLKIGALLGAQLLVTGRASSMGAGALVELEFLDVGSGKIVSKVSRTLSGSRVRKAAVFEAMLTEVIFPERMVGQLDVFLNPPGGSVFLDGLLKVKPAGPQLHLKDVPAGQHTLRVRREGYQDFYAIVQVPFRGTAKLNINMRAGTPVELDSAVRPPGETPEKLSTPWYGHWWLWTAVGVFLVGGTVTAVVLAQ